MAQEEYFLALAQMFTQGQARAAESSRMVAADLREQARYEDEKPFREAQLQKMLTSEKRDKVALEADQFKLAQEKELGPIDIEKAWRGLDVLDEQLKGLEFDNQPEKRKAELESTLAKSIGDQARARYETIQAEDMENPTLRDARRRTILSQLSTAETEDRLASGKADEFFSTMGQREKLRNNEVAESDYKIRSLLKPEQLDELNRLKITAEKISVLAADQNLKNGDIQRVSGLLDILRKDGLLDSQNEELFTQAAQQFISMQSLALSNGATPEAIAKYSQSVSEYLAVNASLSKRGNRVRSGLMSSSLEKAMRAAAADMDAQGMTIDQRLNMVAAHFDAASDAAVIALTREQGGTDSRATSRPGEAALGGMLTGGADSRSTPPPSGGPSRQNAAFESASRDVRGEEKKAYSERRDADFDKSVIRAIGALQDDERGAFNISKVRKQDAKTTRGYSVLRERLASQLGSEPSDAQFSDYVKSLIAPNILRGPARSVQAYIERLYANAASQ